VKRSYTVGIDLHKNSFTYVMLDPRGQISRREKVTIHAKSVERFLQQLPQKSETTLEATSSWGWLADALQDRGHRVHLAHPLKVKVIAECRAKTDKVDAEALARLTAVGWLRPTWHRRTCANTAGCCVTELPWYRNGHS